MKPALKSDVVLTKLIGRLPSWLHPAFHWLGIAFQPAGWGLLLLAYLLMGDPTATIDTVLVLVAIPIATVIKLLFRRQRPPTIYAENMRVKSYSFPSSHAYTAALAGVYFIDQAIAYSVSWLAVTLWGLILLIGISRVHLGAHYPSDVASGWALGAVVTSLILL